MPSLPADLFHLIITDWHPSPSAMCLVNKHFNYIVTPILHENVILDGYHALINFGKTLETGRPILRQHPRSLQLSCSSYFTESFNRVIKQLLMRVPNIVDLHLKFDSLTMRYLLKELRYPFKLLRLSMNPYKDATFVKFLKTQPEIRHLTLTSNQFNFSYNLTQEWSEVTSPLEPDILPNLESIQSDTESISFLVPHRPITSVSILGSQEDFHFHQILVKSSAPLERLTERVRLEDSPWEAAIVSQCLPSLEFCQTSLTEYSLGIFPDPTSHPLVLSRLFGALLLRVRTPKWTGENTKRYNSVLRAEEASPKV
ncbi:hypothetical protein RSAG8_12140, partial [Rhizoctonia solani AG-8 WAC10335]